MPTRSDQIDPRLLASMRLMLGLPPDTAPSFIAEYLPGNRETVEPPAKKAKTMSVQAPLKEASSPVKPDIVPPKQFASPQTRPVGARGESQAAGPFISRVVFGACNNCGVDGHWAQQCPNVSVKMLARKIGPCALCPDMLKGSPLGSPPPPRYALCKSCCLASVAAERCPGLRIGGHFRILLARRPPKWPTAPVLTTATKQ